MANTKIRLARLQLRRELICRTITRKLKVPVDLCDGLRAADGVLRFRIDNSVSGYRRGRVFLHKSDRRNCLVRDGDFSIC
jgi:hypothetical protein